MTKMWGYIKSNDFLFGAIMIFMVILSIFWWPVWGVEKFGVWARKSMVELGKEKSK